jgi:alkylated DNA nucleotide flippase Atl1
VPDPAPPADGPSPAVVVLDLVASVPAGRVTTYGELARAASDLLARPIGPRAVGRIMASAVTEEPWWRVVGHDGRLPPGLEDDARARLRAEGCPLRGERVQVAQARWPL